MGPFHFPSFSTLRGLYKIHLLTYSFKNDIIWKAQVRSKKCDLIQVTLTLRSGVRGQNEGNLSVTSILTGLYITLNCTKSNENGLIWPILSFSTQLLGPESISLNFMLPSCSPQHSFKWRQSGACASARAKKWTFIYPQTKVKDLEAL